MYVCIESNIKHIPLQRHFWLFKVCTSITGSPSSSKSWCDGSPVAVIELRYSAWQKGLQFLTQVSGRSRHFKNHGVLPPSYSLPVYLRSASTPHVHIFNNITNDMRVSCMNLIRDIITAGKVLIYCFWYPVPLFVLYGNGTDHMSNVMQELLVQACRKQSG